MLMQRFKMNPNDLFSLSVSIFLVRHFTFYPYSLQFCYGFSGTFFPIRYSMLSDVRYVSVFFLRVSFFAPKSRHTLWNEYNNISNFVPLYPYHMNNAYMRKYCIFPLQIFRFTFYFFVGSYHWSRTEKAFSITIQEREKKKTELSMQW